MFLNISNSMGSRVVERIEDKDRMQCTILRRIGRSDANPLLQNYVDNENNSPQYLGVASLHLQQLGNGSEFGPLQGKNCSTEET